MREGGREAEGEVIAAPHTNASGAAAAAAAAASSSETSVYQIHARCSLVERIQLCAPRGKLRESRATPTPQKNEESND